METLARAAKVAPADVASRYFEELSSLHARKLWHELTLVLQAYHREPGVAASLPALYADFVCSFSTRIKQLVFAKFAVASAAVVSADEGPDAALRLLEDAGARVRSAGARAADDTERAAVDVLLTVAAAAHMLRAGNLSGAREAVSRAASLNPGGVEALYAVDAAVPALFFGVAAAADKAAAAFSSYYRHALLFLSAADAAGEAALADLGAAAAPHAASDAERAHDLCVAALLGDATYNFGELLVHPVLGALRGTPHAFLADAARALNAGDHASFAALTPALEAHATIGPRMAFLREKMSLMALVDAAFRQMRPVLSADAADAPRGRVLSFAEISAAAGVAPADVELLLVRALSIKLLRGAIDEPRGVFRVDWVLPRVLDVAQVAEMRGAVSAWRMRVQHTAQMF